MEPSATRVRGGIVSTVSRVENHVNEINDVELTFMGDHKMLRGQIDLVKSMRQKYLQIQGNIIADTNDPAQLLVEQEAQQAFLIKCDQLILTIEEILTDVPEDPEVAGSEQTSEESEDGDSDIANVPRGFLTMMEKMMELSNQQHQNQMRQLLSALAHKPSESPARTYP